MVRRHVGGRFPASGSGRDRDLQHTVSLVSEQLIRLLDVVELEAVRSTTTGSVNRAARTAGYSYKGAWLALEAAGNVAHPPLLSTTAQGSQLTAAAAALREAWQRLQATHLATAVFKSSAVMLAVPSS